MSQFSIHFTSAESTVKKDWNNWDKYWNIQLFYSSTVITEAKFGKEGVSLVN